MNQIFDYLNGDDCGFEQEPLERLAEAGELKSFQHKGFWQCMDNIREKEILEKLTLDDLTEEGDCWCVFDDVDKIRDPTVSRLTLALLDNIVANGRSHGGKQINVIVTSHALNDYRKTKYSLENCDYWVIFPSKTIKLQVTTLLRKIGLERETSLYKASRLIIHHSVPLFVITDSMIRLL